MVLDTRKAYGYQAEALVCPGIQSVPATCWGSLGNLLSFLYFDFSLLEGKVPSLSLGVSCVEVHVCDTCEHLSIIHN